MWFFGEGIINFSFPVFDNKLLTIVLDFIKNTFVKLTLGLYWPSHNLFKLRITGQYNKSVFPLVCQQLSNIAGKFL